MIRRPNLTKPRRFISASVLWILQHAVFSIFSACTIVIVASLIAILLTANGDDGVSDQEILGDFGDANGLFFLGHIYQIDVAARTITMSWLIGGCGTYMLENATAFTGSTSCGPVSIPVNVFIDSSSEANFSYNPTAHPRTPDLKVIFLQSLNEFQTTHTLAIHTQVAKLPRSYHYFDQLYFYPFDTYSLSTLFLAMNPSANTSSLPILRLAPADSVNNFYPMILDYSSISSFNGVVMDARVAHLRLKRTALARAFTLLLLIVNWALTMMVVYITVVALVSTNQKIGEGILVLPVTVILTVPALRGLFVESPPFGILLDVLGFFLQMIIVSLCSIILLVGVSLHSPKESATIKWDGA